MILSIVATYWRKQQNQPCRGVLKKKCSENIQQIYGRTPMPKCEHCVKSVQIQSFFWSVFSCILSEYGEILRITSYSVRMRQNMDRKKLCVRPLFTQWKFYWNHTSAWVFSCKFHAYFRTPPDGCFWNRKLHVNKRGNSLLANNFIKYLRSSFWILDDLSCVKDSQTVWISTTCFWNKWFYKCFRLIRQENFNRIIIAHLNINSIRNKFDLPASQIIENLHLLVISETKLETSFPIEQFKIPDFSTPFRRDRDQYGGGLLIFVREDIPAKHFSSEITPSN